MAQSLATVVHEVLPADDSLPATVFLAQPYSRVNVQELSPLGMVAVVAHPLELGTLVILELFNSIQNCWYRKTLRVLHVSEQDDGAWLMSGAFYRPFTEQELLEIIHH
jgi:hypothetical protein